MSEKINTSESIEKQSHYSYSLIDPRPTNEAFINNEKIFQNPNGVLGVEVTIPEYASRCNLGNVDPQHTEGNVDLAAIEIIKEIEVPKSGCSVVTVRADLDSIGSMALLEHKYNGGVLSEEIIERINKIADADKFSRGPWPGEKDFLKSDYLELGDLDAAGAMVMDFKISLTDRVRMMKEYLVLGKCSDYYLERVRADKQNVVSAIENGEIVSEVVSNGNIVYVESGHRAATMVGYSKAPIVIAFNPIFKQGSNEPYKKYTICQYDNSWVDLESVKNELNNIENGWGGSPNIIGSPQGRDSLVNKEKVIEIVEKYIIKREI